MNIIWSEKINLIQILLGLKNHPNTNTNIKKNHFCTNQTEQDNDKGSGSDNSICIYITLCIYVYSPSLSCFLVEF